MLFHYFSLSLSLLRDAMAPNLLVVVVVAACRLLYMSRNNNNKSDSDTGNSQKACTSHVSHSVRLGRLSLSPPMSQPVTRSDSTACCGAGRVEEHGPQAESYWDVRVLKQLVGVCWPLVVHQFSIFFFLIKCVFDSLLRCKKRISYLPFTKPMPTHIHSQLSQLTLMQSQHSD